MNNSFDMETPSAQEGLRIDPAKWELTFAFGPLTTQLGLPFSPTGRSTQGFFLPHRSP